LRAAAFQALPGRLRPWGYSFLRVVPALRRQRCPSRRKTHASRASAARAAAAASTSCPRSSAWWRATWASSGRSRRGWMRPGSAAAGRRSVWTSPPHHRPVAGARALRDRLRRDDV